MALRQRLNLSDPSWCNESNIVHFKAKSFTVIFTLKSYRKPEENEDDQFGKESKISNSRVIANILCSFQHRSLLCYQGNWLYSYKLISSNNAS